MASMTRSARQAIEELKAAGDEEGGIAYDPEAELIMEGHAVVGMSGSGLFDEEGRQVGVVIVETWAMQDRLGLLQQLGLSVPAGSRVNWADGASG